MTALQPLRCQHNWFSTLSKYWLLYCATGFSRLLLLRLTEVVATGPQVIGTRSLPCDAAPRRQAGTGGASRRRRRRVDGTIADMAATIAGMLPGQALDPVINVGLAQVGDNCLRPSAA